MCERCKEAPGDMPLEAYKTLRALHNNPMVPHKHYYAVDGGTKKKKGFLPTGWCCGSFRVCTYTLRIDKCSHCWKAKTRVSADSVICPVCMGESEVSPGVATAYFTGVILGCVGWIFTICYYCFGGF